MSLFKNNNLDIVKKLNDMLMLDREFTEKITDTRYSVNEEYANSNFVCLEDEPGKYSAGLIGVLNGLIHCNNEYRIVGNYDDDLKLINFSLLELINDKWKEV